MTALRVALRMFLLTFTAGEDIRTRRLSLPLLAAAALCGLLQLPLFLPEEAAAEGTRVFLLYLRRYLPGAAVGGGMLLLRFCTKAGIGSGDGVFFLLLHLWFSAPELLTLLLLSLGLCGTAGLLLIVFGHRDRSLRLPLIPFSAAAYLLLTLCGG